MSRRRKIAIACAGAGAMILIVLTISSLLLAKPVSARLQAAVADQVDAEVEWSGVRISLLRDFPAISLAISDFRSRGVGTFAGDTLAIVPEMSLSLHAPSVIRSLRGTGPLLVRSVRLERPDLRLLVHEDGAANWAIWREPAEAESAGDRASLSVDLERLSVRDASLSFVDGVNDLSVRVRGLEHSLNGQIQQDRLTLKTRTTARSASVRFAGIPYLGEAEIDVRGDLDFDVTGRRLTLAGGEARVNELRLALSGNATAVGDSLHLDFAFDTPGTDFREVLSLIPAIHAQGMERIATTGTMRVGGWLRGVHGPGAFPAFHAELLVRDGSFSHVDRPLTARDVQAELVIANPGGHPDSTRIDLTRARASIGADPIEATLAVRTPVSDPAIDAAVRGRLDLAALEQTLQLDGFDELSGLLTVDAHLRTRLSDVEALRYERIAADGTFRATEVVAAGAALRHPLRVEEARARLAPDRVTLETLRGRAGGSDAEVTARIDDPLGFALRGEELRATARIRSAVLNLDEWSSDDEMGAVPVPANVRLDLDAEVGKIVFADLDLRNARGAVRVHDERATLDAFRVETLGGAITASGHYETRDAAAPAFDLDLRVEELQLAEAASSLTTMRALVPVASYGSGRISTELKLAGTLGPAMQPVLKSLTGRGGFRTSGVALRGFPVTARLADALGIEELRDPALADIRSTFTILSGRVHVAPFDVRAGPLALNASGSHGIDGTLDYALLLEVPGSRLGDAAARFVSGLGARLTGSTPGDPRPMSLGGTLTGTVTEPSLALDLRSIGTQVAGDVADDLRVATARLAEEANAAARAAAEETRRAAEAELARRTAAAEERAEEIRARARDLAERARREGEEQAEALVARASNPAARFAAETAARRVREEADRRAEELIRDAEERATALVEEARRERVER